MRSLLDTHFLIWTALEADRLQEFPWIERYRPWGVSPLSLLEIEYLFERGRLTVHTEELMERIGEDRRFVIDEVPLLSLVRQAFRLSWTRDPFDRLIAAHSLARRLPLCTTDRLIRAHHRLLVAELRG